MLFCLFCFAGISTSYADIVLTWDISTVDQGIDLYQVELNGVIVADVLPNTFSVVSIADGDYTARVRAHNLWGWSDFSVPFSFKKGVPDAVVNIRLEVQ